MSGYNTPVALTYLERARAQAPGFAWPALALAHIRGPLSKLADKAKAQSEIAAFFAACPASSEPEAQGLLGRIGSDELQARVAKALRARLAVETDPVRLRDYAVLWPIEFRLRPPQEHAAVREVVAADWARIELLNPHPDAAWLVFLTSGYKLSGAGHDQIAADEDRLIQAFPHSDEAYRIVSERWDNAHKEPEDQSNAAAWRAYNAARRQALAEWMTRFTESRALQQEEFFENISDDPEVPTEEALRSLDKYVGAIAASIRTKLVTVFKRRVIL